MTSPPRPARPLRLPGAVRGLLLTALTLVGLLVFGAVTASAVGLPDPGNRVGVSAAETIFPVGVAEHVSAGEGWGPPASPRQVVVATGVAAEAATGKVTLLGRKADIEKYIAAKPNTSFIADFLNIRGVMAGGKKGVGGWNWIRNKRFIDDGLSSGEVRLVTDPDKPLYSGGNVFQ